MDMETDINEQATALGLRVRFYTIYYRDDDATRAHCEVVEASSGATLATLSACQGEGDIVARAHIWVDGYRAGRNHS